MTMIDMIGWIATAVFVGSYFAKRPDMLRRIQMVGAAIWACYGLLLGAPPVVAANIMVLAAAAWTIRQQRRAAAVDSPIAPH